MWDSRALAKYCVELNWPAGSDLKLGDPNILHEPLFDRKEIIFLPLKQFVKALPTVGDCLKCLILAFPRLSIEKIKVCVFDGPRIRQHIYDEHFIGTMSELEKNAWMSFQACVSNNAKFHGTIQCYSIIAFLQWLPCVRSGDNSAGMCAQW